MIWQVQYQAGEGVLIAAPQGLVLLPGGAPDEALAALWPLIEAGPAPVELLEALGAALPGQGPGAVALEGASGCVLLLKGTAQAVVGDRVVAAESAFAWSEHPVAGAGFGLAGPGQAQPVADGEPSSGAGAQDRWFPIRSGVVAAGAVRVTRLPDDVPRAVEGSQVAPASEPEARVPDADPGAGPGSPPEAAVSGAPPTPPQHARTDAPRDSAGGTPGDEYAWLFEVMSSPEQVDAVTSPPLSPNPEPTPSSEPTPSPSPPLSPNPEPTPSPSPAPPRPPAVDPGETTSLPTIPSGGLSRPPAARPAGRRAPSAPPASSSARHIVERPVVEVVDCPSGHPNSPTSTSCRVCGRKLRSGAVRTVPRPVLGVLRLVSNSPGAPAVIPLDADLILGRGPRYAHEQGCVPVVIGIAGADLSRDHLKVALTDWTVVITDLDSPNGTTVCPARGVVVPLAGGEPCPIDLGTLVTLAGVVTYRFEAPA